MTDLATALADNTKLTPYLGRQVLRTSIKLTKAGDGLSKAKAIDPEQYEPGTKVYVVMECTVGQHTHDLIDGTEAYELVQEFRAGTATVVEHDLVSEVLAEQRARIIEAEEAAKQRTGMLDPRGEQVKDEAKVAEPGDDTDGDLVAPPDVMNAQHNAGVHADGLRPGCPQCDAEAAANQEEADASKADEVAKARAAKKSAKKAAGDGATP